MPPWTFFGYFDDTRILNEVRDLRNELRDFRRVVMAKLADFQAALEAVDAETTRIAGYIQELLAKLAAGGLTEEEESTVLANLGAAAERLKGVGVSPETPVPEGDLPPV